MSVLLCPCFDEGLRNELFHQEQRFRRSEVSR